MHSDVEGAISAHLAANADTVEQSYEDQNLVPAYDETEYDDLDALAADLGGTPPDQLTTTSYDDIAAAIDGDAIYHEALHGETFTSDRPAAEAVERMQLEAEDRTSTGRGLDGAESGLRFHIEEDPFIALWDDDDTTRYAAVQLVPEAQSASCRRTRITYPGKVFAVTGTLDAAPADILPESHTDTPVSDIPVPDNDTARCPAPAADRQEELPEDTRDRQEMMAYTHSQFTDSGTFDQDIYDAMLEEAADNLQHMGTLANLLMDYLEETVEEAYGDDDVDRDWLQDTIATEVDTLLAADAVGFEDGSSDLLTNFFGALQYTQATVRYGVSADNTDDDTLQGWEDEFRADNPTTYAALRREHRKQNVLSLFIPSNEGNGDGLQPYRLLDHLFDEDSLDWDALDTHIAERLPDADDHPAAQDRFSGNETTSGMFQ